MLLIVPIIGCCFGLLFIDHAVAIDNLGSYIAAVLRPAILKCGGGEHQLAWEDHCRTTSMPLVPQFLRFGFPLILSFSGPALMCSLIVIPALRSWWLWLLWAVAVCLQAILAYSWFYIVGRWLNWQPPGLRTRSGSITRTSD